MIHSCDDSINDINSAGLIPLDVALHKLLQAASVTSRTEHVFLKNALGRVLAGDQFAAINVPPADNSSMDGYAVRIADINSSRTLPVSQRIPAGAVAQPLDPDTVARIFTGGEIPAGADAVIMQEQCSERNGLITLPVDITRGQNIRRQGEDITCNNKVLSSGTKLEPHHLGLLASIGLVKVPVYNPLKIAILSTGDELVEIGNTLQAGQLYNSNRYTLAGLLQALNMQCFDYGIVKDDLSATQDLLIAAAQQNDVIISSGGVSVGEEDHIKTAINISGQLDYWRIALKPGKPFAFGHIDNTAFLGLPGNPVSVLVTFIILAKPYLLKRQGISQYQTPDFYLPLRIAYHNSSPREEFIRVRCLPTGTERHIVPCNQQSSAVLSSVAQADGLAAIPPRQSLLPGDYVRFIPFA